MEHGKNKVIAWRSMLNQKVKHPLKTIGELQNFCSRFVRALHRGAAVEKVAMADKLRQNNNFAGFFKTQHDKIRVFSHVDFFVKGNVVCLNQFPPEHLVAARKLNGRIQPVTVLFTACQHHLFLHGIPKGSVGQNFLNGIVLLEECHPENHNIRMMLCHFLKTHGDGIGVIGIV
ncbi:MAG: hypothetical protein Q4C54_06145 [Clostridia bacterium]|nr:hypothetical protein [Clostridia bacterium]